MEYVDKEMLCSEKKTGFHRDYLNSIVVFDSWLSENLQGQKEHIISFNELTEIVNNYNFRTYQEYALAGNYVVDPRIMPRAEATHDILLAMQEDSRNKKLTVESLETYVKCFYAIFGEKPRFVKIQEELHLLKFAAGNRA